MVPPERRVWCNRTLNMRAIKAVGYDMDYTLVHYRTGEWERAAFEGALDPLDRRGWPVGRSDIRSRQRHPGPRVRPGAGKPRQGHEVRLCHPRPPRDPGLVLRGSARRVLQHVRRPRRPALGVHEHPVLAVGGEPLRPARRPARCGPAARNAGLPRPAPDTPRGAGRGAQPEPAETPDHGGPRPLRGARSRPAADTAGPEDGGQAPAPDHEFRLGVHPLDDELRLRPVPARRDEVARALRSHHRRGPEARVLLRDARLRT